MSHGAGSGARQQTRKKVLLESLYCDFEKKQNKKQAVMNKYVKNKMQVFQRI